MATLLSEMSPVARDWGSVNCLASRPWFHRFWVVQEIALGDDPVLVCGKHALPWCAMTLFGDFSSMVHRFPVLDDVGFFVFDAVMTALEYLPNATAIANARRRQRSGWLRMPFTFSLFWLSVNFDSSDPRDRIYALLGLSTARKFTHALRPDYEIEVEDLYVKVARQMLIN